MFITYIFHFNKQSEQNTKHRISYQSAELSVTRYLFNYVVPKDSVKYWWVSVSKQSDGGEEPYQVAYSSNDIAQLYFLVSVVISTFSAVSTPFSTPTADLFFTRVERRPTGCVTGEVDFEPHPVVAIVSDYIGDW
jgi:hypothetical protein